MNRLVGRMEKSKVRLTGNPELGRGRKACAHAERFGLKSGAPGRYGEVQDWE